MRKVLSSNWSFCNSRYQNDNDTVLNRQIGNTINFVKAWLLAVKLTFCLVGQVNSQPSYFWWNKVGSSSYFVTAESLQSYRPLFDSLGHTIKLVIGQICCTVWFYYNEIENEIRKHQFIYYFQQIFKEATSIVFTSYRRLHLICYLVLPLFYTKSW